MALNDKDSGEIKKMKPQEISNAAQIMSNAEYVSKLMGKNRISVKNFRNFLQRNFRVDACKVGHFKVAKVRNSFIQ